MMEFQELRVFQAVIDCGGFLRASESLHLTQSAVSQSIANLERKLGEKLIERKSPVRPTAIGKELLSHARFILEREQEFLTELTRLRGGYLQKLSLTVDYLVNEYIAHDVVLKTLRRLPEMSFRIKRLPAREMIRAVLAGHFDLGFGPFQKNMDQLNTYKLFEQTSYLVVSPRHPALKTYRTDPMGSLKEMVLLASYLDEPALRPSKVKIRDYFKAAWEIDNIGLQIRLVEKQVGATYLPEKILQQDFVARKFTVIEKIPFSRVTKPYGIYHRQGEPLLQCAQTFIQEAQKL